MGIRPWQLVALGSLVASAFVRKGRAAPTPGGTYTPDTGQPSAAHMRQSQRELARQILAGDYLEPEWVDVPCGRFTLHVSRDTLRIRRGADTVRPGVCPPMAQALARHWHCQLLTPRMADAISIASTARVGPFGLWQPGADIADLKYEVEQAQKVDAALAQLGDLGAGPIESLGKHWVIGKAAEQAWARARHRCNYGWPSWAPTQFPAASWNLPAGRFWVLQPCSPSLNPTGLGQGMAHGDEHSDYSQTFRLCARLATLDGREVDLAQALQDPALASDLSLDGPVAPELAGLEGVDLEALAS